VTEEEGDWFVFAATNY